MGRGIRIAILLILAAVLAGGVAWNVPRPLNALAGPVLALLMIIFSILAIMKPHLDGLFRKFIFVSLAGWFAVCIGAMVGNLGNWTSGPWCVLGVGNLKNPLVLTFGVVLATSIVMPRAWCNYVCPNRGLFEFLSGRRRGGRAGCGDANSLP